MVLGICRIWYSHFLNTFEGTCWGKSFFESLFELCGVCKAKNWLLKVLHGCFVVSLLKLYVSKHLVPSSNSCLALVYVDTTLMMMMMMMRVVLTVIMIRKNYCWNRKPYKASCFWKIIVQKVFFWSILMVSGEELSKHFGTS